MRVRIERLFGGREGLFRVGLYPPVPPSRDPMDEQLTLEEKAALTAFDTTEEQLRKLFPPDVIEAVFDPVCFSQELRPDWEAWNE